MHKVDIRLTNEGNETTNVFELYTEALKDGRYVETQPMQEYQGGGAPIVLFLEQDERVIIVAKGNKGRIVFDKEQNANIRVETEEEKKERAEREERIAERQADDKVASAKSSAAEIQAQADTEKARAEAAVRQAEREKQEALKSAPKPVTPAKPPGNPASANTSPIDSKDVKKEGA